MKNPFHFGQRVMVPHASHSRMITEIVSDTKIRILDLVEITERQRRDWLRSGVKGEFKFIPGLVIDIEGVKDWDTEMAAFEARIRKTA
jgi:hypothetical protein